MAPETDLIALLSTVFLNVLLSALEDDPALGLVGLIIGKTQLVRSHKNIGHVPMSSNTEASAPKDGI